ncbi:hypothetical protein UFOVP116_315 [uncultured Caudovirales phage]|uniref:Uncharacterized protein n=1 Tax=uncultured Caudovirales phage TaxID=2100421 RepID=A0A6J5L708_9CAUD|nr:hypothetical protein UFOVP116_315 [uncultured Caudovirales phage]
MTTLTNTIKPDIYWYTNMSEPVLDFHDKSAPIAWEVSEKFHRIGGPAIEYANGGEMWFYFGKMHRIDGPAVVHADGAKSWWYHGRFCADINSFCDMAEMKDADRTLFLLKWQN